MANSPSVIDFNIRLADFLATVVGDGTWEDIFNALKIDKTGFEADATDIDAAAGQLWGNAMDDFFQAVYQRMYKGAKFWTFADATARDALGSDDGLGVNDVGFQEDTKELYYVVSVDGPASSTWALLPGVSANTWAQVLTAGNVSGANDPTLSNPQKLTAVQGWNLLLEAGPADVAEGSIGKGAFLNGSAGQDHTSGAGGSGGTAGATAGPGGNSSGTGPGGTGGTGDIRGGAGGNGTGGGVSGGDGGPMNVRGGTGGAANGAGIPGDGGATTVQGGDGGLGSGTQGGGAGATTLVRGGEGGVTSGTGAAGNGGDLVARGGAGPSTSSGSTAGDGGAGSFYGGDGGNVIVSGPDGGDGGNAIYRGGHGGDSLDGTPGNAGSADLRGGDGGNATGGTANGGAGGVTVVRTGDGGDSAGGTPGNGAQLTIWAGDGGDRTSGNGDGGDGGDVQIKGGLEGSGSGTGSNGARGKVRIGQDDIIFPDSDGSSGQVMTTDGAAELTFKWIRGQLAYSIPGTLATGTNKGAPLRPSQPLVIEEVYIEVKTAPTGSGITVDVNKNGTSIFNVTPANRPTIAAGATTATSGAPDTTALAKNDQVTVDIDAVGSTTPGDDLTVMVRCKLVPAA